MVDGLLNYTFTRYLPTKNPIKEPLGAFILPPTPLWAFPAAFLGEVPLPLRGTSGAGVRK